MGLLKAKTRQESVIITAKVIRADGTIEDIGIVAEWHRSPLKRLLKKVKNLITHKGE